MRYMYVFGDLVSGSHLRDNPSTDFVLGSIIQVLVVVDRNPISMTHIVVLFVLLFQPQGMTKNRSLSFVDQCQQQMLCRFTHMILLVGIYQMLQNVGQSCEASAPHNTLGCEPVGSTSQHRVRSNGVLQLARTCHTFYYYPCAFHSCAFGGNLCRARGLRAANISAPF